MMMMSFDLHFLDCDLMNVKDNNNERKEGRRSKEIINKHKQKRCSNMKEKLQQRIKEVTCK